MSSFNVEGQDVSNLQSQRSIRPHISSGRRYSKVDESENNLNMNSSLRVKKS